MGGKEMKTKILGIFIVTLLIATAVLPVLGTMNEVKDNDVFSTNLSEVEWSNTYGGEGADKFWNVAETDDGGYIASGTTVINISNKNQCPWVLKVDSEGNEMWDWSITEFTVDNENLEITYSGCYDILQSPDGGYIISLTGLQTRIDDELYQFGGLAKLDSDGNEEWIKLLGDGFDWTILLQELLEVEDGYMGAGSYRTPLVDSDLNLPGFLVKINYEGELIWYKEYDYGGFRSVFHGISFTNDGGFLLLGNARTTENIWNGWMVKTNSQGEKEWDKTFGGNYNDYFWDGFQKSNGEYIAAGWTESFDPGIYSSVWVITTDIDGDVILNKTIGGGIYSYDVLYGFDTTDDGGFILPAIIDWGASRQYGWVVKFDDELNVEWNHIFYEERRQNFIGVSSTSDGGCIASGISGLWDSVNSDALLVKYAAFENERPNKPATPSGPAEGSPDTEYTFTTTGATDPDGDSLQYMWDWGDGNFSDWLDTNDATHTWTYEDNFEVSVMAMDEHGGESDWSDPFEFSTPKNKEINTPFIRFLENYPHLFPLLRQLLGLQ